jgi:hypothetical protein
LYHERWEIEGALDELIPVLLDQVRPWS